LFALSAKDLNEAEMVQHRMAEFMLCLGAFPDSLLSPLLKLLAHRQAGHPGVTTPLPPLRDARRLINKGIKGVLTNLSLQSF
jgi:hypothetical protein